MAKLTNARSRKSGPKTSLDLFSAISSPESESGAMPCDAPAGLTTDLFGQEVVLAPASARPDRGKALMTLVTSGLLGHDSSGSASLQRSLENRLMMRLDMVGSTLFKLTWRGKRTPLGRRYLEHAVSARRKSDNDYTSWPRPNTPSGGRSTSTEKMDATGRTVDGAKHTASLEHAVKFAAWPRPMAGSPATENYNEAGNTDSGRKTVLMVGWCRPKASASGQDYARRNREKSGGDDLATQVQLVVSGEMPTGSIVQTESTGQLNPEHSRWLMGIPTAWGRCAAMVTRSVRRKRQSS